MPEDGHETTTASGGAPSRAGDAQPADRPTHRSPPPPSGGADEPTEKSASDPDTGAGRLVSPAGRWLVWLVPAALFVGLAAVTVVLWIVEAQALGSFDAAGCWIILIGGLASATLLAAATARLLWQRERSAEWMRRYLAALESLNRVGAGLAAHPDAGDAAMTELAEASRQLLGMGRCGVLRLGDGPDVAAAAPRADAAAPAGNPDDSGVIAPARRASLDGLELHLLAYAGDMPPAPPRVYPLDQLPACKACLAAGEIVLDGDTERPAAAPRNADVVRQFGARAMVLVPLRVGGRPIGLMTLGGSAPRQFADADRRLAQLLGSQASVILANRWMYERARSALDVERRLARQRDALSHVHTAVYGAATAGEALRRIVDLAPPVLDADFCGVALRAADGEGMEVAAATPPYESLVGRRITGPTPLADEVFRTRRPRVVRDAATEPGMHPAWRQIPDAGSVLALPLFDASGGPLGVLALVRRRTGDFTAEQVDVSQLFAARAAVAIENARLRDRMAAALDAQRQALAEQKRLMDQRDALWAIHAEADQAGSLDGSLQRIVSLAPDALGADLCSISLTTGRPEELYIAAVTPGPVTDLIGVPLDVRTTLGGRAMRTAEVVMVADARDDPGVSPLFRGRVPIGTLLYVPLRRPGDASPMGVLVLLRHEPAAFGRREVELAKVFSARAAAAIENARLREAARAALDAERQVTAQRDALWEIATAVYRAATLRECVDRVVQLIPRALGVDACTVNLCTGRPDEMALAAFTGDVARHMIGEPYPVAGTHAGHAASTGEIVAVADASTDPKVVARFHDVARLRSLLYVPLLRADRTALGIMVLIRHEVNPFTDEQVALARLFSVRAAGAIENAQLMERTRDLLAQTRRDAETKAELLRELNHRVKNNLAGIVGLLTIGEPDMPPAVRRWLDRAVDRIRAMAGAHELFVGGADTVPLGELVAKVLDSLAVATPVGVDVRTDVSAVPVRLRTEQAISLAMVLHEVCFNSLVHGLGGGAGGGGATAGAGADGALTRDQPQPQPRGSLTIVARPGAAAEEIVITVTDEPTAGGRAALSLSEDDNGHTDAAAADGAHVMPPSGGTGVGLDLVRGLVRRELRGRFLIAPNAAGGTTATIEFRPAPVPAAAAPATPSTAARDAGDVIDFNGPARAAAPGATASAAADVRGNNGSVNGSAYDH